MPTTTNRGYTYPDSSGHDRLWEHYEELAQDIDTDVNAHLNKPVGRIVQTVAQTGVANNTMTAVTFSNTDDFDNHDIHNPAVNNNRVTPTLAGVYGVKGSVAIGGQTDYSTVEVCLLFNGVAYAPATRISPSAVAQTLLLPVSAHMSCNGSGDYFGIGFRLNRSSGTSGTVVSVQFASVLEWEWLCEL